MTGYEIDNFYALDCKEYILENNFDFMFWYNEKLNAGYQPFLSMKELQNIINEIVSFFEFKYHRHMILDMEHHNKSSNYLTSLEIAEKLGIEELKYRLHFDYVQLLNCNYPRYFELRKEKINFGDLTRLYVNVNSDGTFSKETLLELKEYKYLDNIEGITTASDLLGRFLSIPTDVDYSSLERMIFNHKTNLELRNKILELTTLAMLYSKKSLPDQSYIRIKNFIRMFNKEYNLDLNTTKIDKIMSMDYDKEITKPINITQEEKTPSKLKVLSIRKKLINNKKDNC